MSEPHSRIRTLVVDDELPARQLILSFLQRDPDIQVVCACADGDAAVDVLRREHVDLVFLDIQMPGQNGFDVLRQIPTDRLPLVIFVTAYDDYALQAFEVHALAYLLKPISKRRFFEEVARAKDQIRAARVRDWARRLATLAEELGPRGTPPATVTPPPFTVKSGARLFTVPVADVQLIESADHYVRLVTDAREHLVHDSISDLEARLAPHHFVRIHRTALVNARHVSEVRQEASGVYYVVLRNGSRRRVSRSHRQAVARLLPGHDRES